MQTAIIMKFAIVLSLFLVALEAVPSALGDKASVCSDDECTGQCRCSSAEHPLPDTDLEDLPQLISLTFNEALTEDIVKKFWKPLFFNRANPDQVPIGATFFVPHEYTNYKMVNDVFNLGFEVAVHSITKTVVSGAYLGTCFFHLVERIFVYFLKLPGFPKAKISFIEKHNLFEETCDYKELNINEK